MGEGPGPGVGMDTELCSEGSWQGRRWSDTLAGRGEEEVGTCSDWEESPTWERTWPGRGMWGTDP